MLNLLRAARCGENAPDRSELMRKNAKTYGVDLEALQR